MGFVQYTTFISGGWDHIHKGKKVIQTRIACGWLKKVFKFFSPHHPKEDDAEYWSPA